VVVLGPPSVAQACSRAHVFAAAVTAEPIPSDDSRLIDAIPDLNAAPPENRMKIFRREVSIKRRALSSCMGLKEFIAQWRPNVVLRDSTELAAWAVCESLGIPHISVEVGLYWSEADYTNAASEELRKLRSKVGLRDCPNPAEGLYRFLHLSNSPPGFLPADVVLPIKTEKFRPAFFDEYGNAGGPDLRNIKSPCVYVAFGTLYKTPDEMVTEMVRFLASRFETVLLCGDYSIDHSGVKIARYIPQSSIMNECSLVVCHGGRSTVLTALARAVPVVCLPLGSDHFFVGRRIADLGLGASCEWSVKKLASATSDRKLNRYSKAAHNYSAAILEMRNVVDCAEIVEEVVRSS
jgi:UDP:flavonoid glycosyltransferase YjiC (YdhE family)